MNGYWFNNAWFRSDNTQSAAEQWLCAGYAARFEVLWSQNRISVGTNRASLLYLAVHIPWLWCSVSARGIYCSFAVVLDRLVPTEFTFFPHVEPRYVAVEDGGRFIAHLSVRRACIPGCT